MGEVIKFLALLVSILALGHMLGHAFFVPGHTWQQRLIASAENVVLAMALCFAGGIAFQLTTTPAPRISRTLPVQLFTYAISAAAVLFVISWYLDTYYVPLLWRNQPH